MVHHSVNVASLRRLTYSPEWKHLAVGEQAVIEGHIDKDGSVGAISIHVKMKDHSVVRIEIRGRAGTNTSVKKGSKVNLVVCRTFEGLSAEAGDVNVIPTIAARFPPTTPRENFTKLASRHIQSDHTDILSITPVTNGYLLAVRYRWNDGSFREEALFIVEPSYGPKAGELRLGWTHVIHEHDVDPG